MICALLSSWFIFIVHVILSKNNFLYNVTEVSDSSCNNALYSKHFIFLGSVVHDTCASPSKAPDNLKSKLVCFTKFE